MKPILDQASYTFADYFKLGCETEELMAFFGCQFSREPCDLPRSGRNLDRLPDLLRRLEKNTRLASLGSEVARREFLIAPVLTELMMYTDSKVRVGNRSVSPGIAGFQPARGRDALAPTGRGLNGYAGGISPERQRAT